MKEFPAGFQYSIRQLLQNGYISSVYSAEDPSGQPVVVKRPRYANEQSDREAQILADISHPHIIGLKQVAATEDGPCIILPYAQGGDLFMAIENGPIAESLVREIAYHITSALQYLHERSIWHLDVKPDNVLFLDELRQPESVVLTDFGLAKTLAEETCSEEPCGSVQYSAPELFEGVPFTKAVDMWALGMTIYVCLVGEFPFEATDTSSVIQEIRNGLPGLFQSKSVPELSQEAKDLIQSLLQVDPEGRPTAEEVLRHPWFGPLRSAASEEIGTVSENSPYPRKDSSADDGFENELPSQSERVAFRERE
jgi:serine/threonine protein kinase